MMGKKLLFVNVSKNTHIFVHQTAEAERFGHTVYNLTDVLKPTHRTLKHIEHVPAPHTRERYIEKIKNMYKRLEIDYICTQCEVLYPILDDLHREGYSVLPKVGRDIDEITNKEYFNYYARRIGLPAPDDFIPTDLESLLNLGFDKPIFVKPTNGTDGTIKMHLTADKYSYFDYCRFDSMKAFIDNLDKSNYVDRFIKTQNEGMGLPSGKGVDGILGKHIIQECIASQYYFSLNVLVADNNIKFTLILKTQNDHDMEIYYLDKEQTEVLKFEKDDNNHAKARDFLGKDVYESFMTQITKLVQDAKIELAAIHVAFVEFRPKRWCLQDVHFRQSGLLPRIVRVPHIEKDYDPLSNPYYDISYLRDVYYDSIWEYV